MKLTMTITCDNEAFTGDPAVEVARILREYADKIERGSDMNRNLFDYNGNRVGEARTDD